MDTLVFEETIRGKVTNVIAFPTILSVAREHYGCPTLTGMPLENGGEGGSIGSHWEKEAILNEFMIANSIDSDS